jgi:hypothetical protein
MKTFDRKASAKFKLNNFTCHIGCSFKFNVKAGFEKSIVNAPRISCLNLTSLFTLFVFLVCKLTSGAFTINSSTSTLRGNLNKQPIFFVIIVLSTVIHSFSLCFNLTNIFVNTTYLIYNLFRKLPLHLLSFAILYVNVLVYCISINHLIL